MVDLSDYTHSGTWDLIRSPGKLSVYNATENKPKLTDIRYHIVLRRKTLFYTGENDDNVLPISGIKGPLRGAEC